MIRIQNLTKIYGQGEAQVKALNGINLTIEAGEMVAIMGPSGSGKSTLLNILGCLDNPTKGEYFLLDKNVANLSSKSLAGLRNKSLGFIVQDFALIDRYTVYQNVALPLDYAKADKKQKKLKVEKLLDSLGIADKYNVLAMNLSGGQRQRVAIARAIINAPSIVLADEPTGALDQANGQEVIEQLLRINHIGTTVVIVTHDEAVAARCQRIIRIMDGNIVQ